jgi:DNA sulfur modification protein DndB
MTQKSALFVPALKAKMGDNVYYISFMSMKEIADRVSFSTEIHKSKKLGELIQRQVTNRSRVIATYLITQPQRFFNALIIGVYAGAPKWYELSIENSRLFDSNALPMPKEGALGILKLDGDEKLFAIDGQHRVAGIKQALSGQGSSSGLEDEEICTIFIAADVREESGLERTRRLFTTLNRYAKPVSMMDIIAMDEDDVIAITIRQLVGSYQLCQDHRILMSKGKMIPVTDNTSFTTIETLYDVLNIILKDRKIGWNKFKRFRPSDSMLSSFYEQASDFWNLMIEHFPPLAEVRDSTRKQKVAGKYRHREGGHLLFRPVGLLSLAEALKLAKDKQWTLSNCLDLIANLPMDIASEPWVGLLWDGIGKRVITRKENQKLAALLLLYMIGVNYAPENKLRELYASALNRPIDEVHLPAKIA